METNPFAESGVTNVRREVKVLLDPDEAHSVAGALARFMPPEESRIVAVYFDAPGAPLAQRASATPGDCVKVRVKAYAPDRSAVPGRVVLEVKRERGGITTKERIWLPLAEVREAVAKTLAPTFGALAPEVASSYRRRVYQTTPHWRVTIDDGLTFHRAGWSLFADDGPGLHGVGLEPALGAEPRVVVELKFGPDGMPRWLARLAWSRGTTYSKFAAAVGLGELVQPRGA